MTWSTKPPSFCVALQRCPLLALMPHTLELGHTQLLTTSKSTLPFPISPNSFVLFCACSMFPCSSDTSVYISGLGRLNWKIFSIWCAAKIYIFILYFLACIQHNRYLLTIQDPIFSSWRNIVMMHWSYKFKTIISQVNRSLEKFPHSSIIHKKRFPFFTQCFSANSAVFELNSKHVLSAFNMWDSIGNWDSIEK